MYETFWDKQTNKQNILLESWLFGEATRKKPDKQQKIFLSLSLDEGVQLSSKLNLLVGLFVVTKTLKSTERPSQKTHFRKQLEPSTARYVTRESTHEKILLTEINFSHWSIEPFAKLNDA